MKVSNCCGAAPRNYNNDCDSIDLGLCPQCGEHCEYEEEGGELLTREFTPEQEAVLQELVKLYERQNYE